MALTEEQSLRQAIAREEANLAALEPKTTKKRREELDRLATIPDDEERLVLATGRYIGEGFDDA
jgi:hypothetical protein